jgi:ribonuclease HII
MRVEDPTDQVEKELFSTGARFIAGIDEVGRGAWAGPVSVGITVVDIAALAQFPRGVRDSKMLSPQRREQIFPLIADAVCAWSVGHASSDECDQLGMTRAQRLATSRAIESLSLVIDAVILDGVVNFTDHEHVLMSPGADRTSLVVAAASILAKVTRDQLMTDFEGPYPGYGFAKSKGYPSPQHLDGISRFGLTDIHRVSWSFAERYRR